MPPVVVGRHVMNLIRHHDRAGIAAEGFFSVRVWRNGLLIDERKRINSVAVTQPTEISGRAGHRLRRIAHGFADRFHFTAITERGRISQALHQLAVATNIRRLGGDCSRQPID